MTEPTREKDMTSTPTAAFLGTGRMGLPMTMNLASVYAGAATP
jgi:hypothetical protein